MKNIRLTLKVRIIIAVVAIAAIHAGFTFIPRWWDARPRFYPDAWAEADAILREEVGDAAVDKGLFFIPKDKVSVPRRQSVMVSFSAYSAGGRTGAYGGNSSCLVREDHVLIGSPRRLAKVNRETARHILATFAYLSQAFAIEPDGRTYDGAGAVFATLTKDNITKLDTNPAPRGATLTIVCPRLGFRYSDRLQEILPFVEGEEEIARHAYLLLREVVPPHSLLEQRAAVDATDLLAQYPCVDAVRFLRKIIRIRETRKSFNLRNLLRSIPIIGRAFGASGEPYDIPNPEIALAMALVLGGKSPPERTDAALALAFAKGETPEELRYFKAIPYLVVRSPEVFCERLLREWSDLSTDVRRWGLICLARSSADVEPVARLAAANDDEHLRFLGNYHLFKATGDERYLDACLALLPLWDNASVKTTLASRWHSEYAQLADLYEEDRSLAPIAQQFIRAWRSVPQTSRNRYLFERLPLPECFATLVRAGGPDAASAFVEMMDASADPAALPDDGEFHGDAAFALEFAASYARDELVRTRDPAYADAMLAFLEKQPLHLREVIGRLCVNCLITRGDLRVLGVIEQELSTVKDTGSHQSQEHINWLSRSAAELRLRNAPDPLAYLLASTPQEHALTAAPAAELLAARFTEDQLLALLADDSCAPIRMHVFLALTLRRHLDKEASVNE